MIAAAGLILAVTAPARAERPPAALPPPVVASVTFQVASPYLISYEELAGLIALRPGDALTSAAVREAIRGLYAKSLFREVSAFAREEDGKAHLLFYLRPSPVITEIEVVGAKLVPSAQLVLASRLRRGIALEERDFREAEKAAGNALRKKGFTKSSVSIFATCNIENGTGKVRIEVAEGSPAVIRSVDFPGSASFPREKILGILGAAVGAPYDFRRWEEGIKKLRIAYKREGFLAVRLAEAEVTCEREDGICIESRVDEGPRYAVKWTGPRKYPVEKLEKACGLYGDEETTEGGLLHDIRERLLAFYREKDHLFARVQVEAGEQAGGGRRLDVTVQEGVPGYLKEIRFEGNQSIPGKRLRKQMTSEERGFFHYVTGSGRFREEEWNDDILALVGLYQKEGFVRARAPSIDTTWDETGGLTKTVHIEEGLRYRLREIRFRGNDHFLRDELMEQIGNRDGSFVDYVGLERDQEEIGTFYRNQGYLDARLTTRLVFDEGKDTVAVLFDVEEGARYRLGKVVVRGNLLTDPVVVLREVTVREGAPAGERDLLKFQQAVFATGLFKSVRVQKVKRPSDGILDVIVEVDETLFFEVEFGGGYGTDTGLRGFVGAKHVNLDGMGRRISGRAAVSQKEEKFIGDLREPWILGNRWKWEGGLTGSHQETRHESFSLRKTGIVGSINQTFFERSSLSLQYEFSRDRVFDLKPGAILSPEDQGGANIAAVRAIIVLDFRDDPFNPLKGSFNSGTAELASAYLGSEVDYYKLVGQSSWYIPVFRKTTFVLSGRAGYVAPMRDTLEVPIQKRFFIGGRTTVRGFREESLGPKSEDGTPTGGNSMVNANVELRVPLQYGFLVAPFLDAGSVWLRGTPGKGFDLRESAGLGLRYGTPIGPIALDYAWKLDRRDGESGSEWHFTIGAVF
jgi:outer membrane protein insertion porin family